jgi:hypothetical protein
MPARQVLPLPGLGFTEELKLTETTPEALSRLVGWLESDPGCSGTFFVRKHLKRFSWRLRGYLHDATVCFSDPNTAVWAKMNIPDGDFSD